jgi:hypothetical protein
MHAAPLLDRPLGADDAALRGAVPSSWDYKTISRFATGLVDSPINTLLAPLCPLVLYWLILRIHKMQSDYARPFPFESLPQELRDMVYENLLEEPCYPPPPTSQPPSSLNWMLPARWSPSSSPPRKPTRPGKNSSWLFLANKQIYQEYTDVLCKRSTFHLTVSPQNYRAPSPTNTDKLWTIAPSTLKHLRRASLQLVTTSHMLGSCDPRNMVSAEWALAQQLRDEVSAMAPSTHLTLDAKAIGDPLWNPLWIWFHSAASFKNMGTPASLSCAAGEPPKGPRLQKLTFSLDTWSPGENYLARDDANEGAWTWYCMKGHSVAVDGPGDVTVREFCGRLYQECRVCRPEGDDDEDEASEHEHEDEDEDEHEHGQDDEDEEEEQQQWQQEEQAEE